MGIMECTFFKFCDELNDIRSRFHKWDICEKTIALYYLMNNLPFSNARFLQHSLDHCITSIITPELEKLEANANDIDHLRELLDKYDDKSIYVDGCEWDTVLKQLLAKLPLLKAGNTDLAHFYLKTIERAVSELNQNSSTNTRGDIVELVSYIFIHPAFDQEARTHLKELLKNIPSENSNFDSLLTLEDGKRRSNSLTQTIGHNEITDLWQASSQENLSTNSSSSSISITVNSTATTATNNSSPPKDVSQKPRSLSLSSETTGTNNLLHQKTISCSETRSRNQKIMSNLPIMKGVVYWLKSLRLHKYSWVFTNLTYDQMLNLTDDQLECAGITKGARHKLLLSIAKLRERSSLLTELETDVMSGGDLLSALKKLKTVLHSPLQVTDSEDLPSHFVKVMGKICTQLLMLRQPPEECLSVFSVLCSRTECLDAFSIEQKCRLNLWRSQLCNSSSSMQSRHVVHQLKQLRNYRYKSNRNGYSLSPRSYMFSHESSPALSSSPCSNNSSSSLHSPQSSTYNIYEKNPSSFKLNSSLDSYQNQSPIMNGSNTSYHVTYPSNDITSKESFNNSLWCYPSKNWTLGTVDALVSTNSNDIDSNLESLCLQMMEHALGP